MDSTPLYWKVFLTIFLGHNLVTLRWNQKQNFICRAESKLSKSDSGKRAWKTEVDPPKWCGHDSGKCAWRQGVKKRHKVQGIKHGAWGMGFKAKLKSIRLKVWGLRQYRVRKWEWGINQLRISDLKARFKGLPAFGEFSVQKLKC